MRRGRSETGRLSRLMAEWLVPVGFGLVVALVVVRLLEHEGNRSVPVTESVAPWPLPDRLVERIREADTPPYREKGVQPHSHAHLDMFVDGQPIPVPANLGLPNSSLHTHSDSGILHMESSDEDGRFTLGQLFVIWGVRLTTGCVGGYCQLEKPIAIYINGRRQHTALPKIRLTSGSEIALIIGSPPSSIPVTYDCHNAAAIERASCRQSFRR